MFLPAFMFLCLFVFLSVCLSVQHNSKSYGSMLMKFSGDVGNVTKKR